MFNQHFKRISPFQQLILLIIITLSSWLITSIISMLLGTVFFDINLLENPNEIYNNVSFLKFLQASQSIGLFIIPPIIFAWIYSNNSINSYLLTNNKTPIIYLISAVVIVIISQPFISMAGVFNNGIEFPEYLKDIGNWMREKEDEAQNATELFLSSSSNIQLLINILIIAILPAIGEEFLFRGALQRIFFSLFKNIHIAVWVSAVLFSAMHIQFFGFLPRLILGLIFGYLVVYTGNIWLAILAHFTNNFLALFLYHHYLKNPETANPLDLNQNYPESQWVIAGVAGTILILWWLKIRPQKESNPYIT